MSVGLPTPPAPAAPIPAPAAPAVAASTPTPAPAGEPDPRPLAVIEPAPGWRFLNLAELWRYRELLFFLAWRDVKARYKQTVFGLGWAVAQPLATMGVFALFLGSLGGVGGRVENYALFVFAGMVAWAFFSNTVTAAGNSVVGNERLVTKIYFPRLIIPLSTVGVGLFDLAIASGLLAVMAACYGVTPGWSVLLLPLIVALLAATAAGIGVLISALLVAQRDFRFVLSFGVQLWMFATPCLYLPTDDLGDTAKTLLPLNPAYGLILAFRQAALGNAIDPYALGVSAAVGLTTAAAGVLYFRRVERSFADDI